MSIWLFTCTLGIVFGVVLLGWLSTNWFVERTEPQIFQQIDEIPFNQVGLVLGTSHRTTQGTENLYFKYRIEAAAKLYFAEKVHYLLLSGDNRHLSYNEPAMMRKALRAKGVPDAAMISDYAGFRTLDSVVRAQKVFGQDQITIISQPFHLPRALFIAEQSQMQAIGFAAQSPYPPSAYTKKVEKREFWARLLAIGDMLIWHEQPRFLGEKQNIVRDTQPNKTRSELAEEREEFLNEY